MLVDHAYPDWPTARPQLQRTFGLAQRLPPPHRVFPRRLIAVTGRIPGGLLTPARCAELEAALAILQPPRRSRRPMKKTACFHDCVTRTTLPRSVRSHWSKNSSAITTSRNDTIMQSRPCATMARRRGPRPRSCEDTSRHFERSISDTSMSRTASCSPRQLGYCALRRSRTSAVKWRNVDPVASY